MRQNQILLALLGCFFLFSCQNKPTTIRGKWKYEIFNSYHEIWADDSKMVTFHMESEPNCLPYEIRNDSIIIFTDNSKTEISPASAAVSFADSITIQHNDDEMVLYKMEEFKGNLPCDASFYSVAYAEFLKRWIEKYGDHHH